jgi:hypothetical protein
VIDTAPGHVATVRQTVIDPLDENDIEDLGRVMGKVLAQLDPENRIRVQP